MADYRTPSPLAREAMAGAVVGVARGLAGEGLGLEEAARRVGIDRGARVGVGVRGDVPERGVGPGVGGQAAAVFAGLAVGLVVGEGRDALQGVGLCADVALRVADQGLQGEAGAVLLQQTILAVVAIRGGDAATVGVGEDVVLGVVGPGLGAGGGDGLRCGDRRRLRL